MRKTFLYILLSGLILLLAACSADPFTPPPDQPVTSDDTLQPTQTPLKDDMTMEEKAYIDTVDVLILESFPLQVMVNVKGNLPDGCTTIAESWAEQVDDTTFEVHIGTVRRAGGMCTQALVPFEENIPLDVAGLPAGTYTVKVYDQTAEFTFEQDNTLPE